MSTPARADLITLDAASVALGVDVSDAFDGLTMQRISTPGFPPAQTYSELVVGPVITSAPHYGLFGGTTVSFGQFDGGYGLPYDWCYTYGQCANVGFFSVLELTFNVPTNFVQIIGDAAPGLDPMLFAYDRDGALITHCKPFTSGGENPGCDFTFTELEDGIPYIINDVRQTVSLTSDQRNIARVVFGGSTGGAQATVISYEVPEPSSLLLLGLGAVGLLRASRQRETQQPE
jgi:hypothetical protein